MCGVCESALFAVHVVYVRECTVCGTCDSVYCM